MSVLFVAVPIAVLLAGSGVFAFVWATRRGQLDDDVPAVETTAPRRQ